MLLIDGLNLAYWIGAPPSLRVPLAAANAAVIAGWEPLVVLDASARWQLPEAEHDALEALLRLPVAHQVPSGTDADRLLLARAQQCAPQVRIASRDRFREHRRRHRGLLRRPGLVIGGAVEDGVLRLDADLPVADLAPDVDAALAVLQRLRIARRQAPSRGGSGSSLEVARM